MLEKAVQAAIYEKALKNHYIEILYIDFEDTGKCRKLHQDTKLLNGENIFPESDEQMFDEYIGEKIISLTSKEGKGTEFVVTLNFKILEKSKPLGVKEEPLQKMERENRYSGKKVLLVEDNELNREIATALLEEIGITVDSVEDGTDAVERMNEVDDERYDLIFMDIQMPKMDGYMTTREIRTLKNNKKANIPIIAMTANAFEEDKKKAFKAGMNAHIAKPIDIKTILAAFEQVFGTL